MADPLNIDSAAYAGQVEKIGQNERMGVGLVPALEKPIQAMTLGADGKPKPLPWKTGKPLGAQQQAFGTVGRVLDDAGNTVAMRLKFDVLEREQAALDEAARQAETREAMAKVDGIPQTNAFNEHDHYTTKDVADGAIPEQPRCSLVNINGLRCVFYASHSGDCAFEACWPDFDGSISI